MLPMWWTVYLRLFLPSINNLWELIFSYFWRNLFWSMISVFLLHSYVFAGPFWSKKVLPYLYLVIISMGCYFMVILFLHRLLLQWSSKLCSILTRHRILNLRLSSLKHLTMCLQERSIHISISFSLSYVGQCFFFVLSFLVNYICIIM